LLHFRETALRGAWLIEPTPVRDGRGFFMRTFCAQQFSKYGIEPLFVQNSVSYSAAKGTLRGMHFQRAPHAEAKVVSCLKGAVWDVIIDLRLGSPTFLQWQGFPLSEENRNLLYVPKGFAHGFQTLQSDSEVGYLISAFYVPEAAGGVRYDDPAFAITWPLPPVAVSDRDRSWPNYAARAR
jgi:dTDP-4-dehydrorhamnose 3,5-epimerase